MLTKIFFWIEQIICQNRQRQVAWSNKFLYIIQLLPFIFITHTFSLYSHKKGTNTTFLSISLPDLRWQAKKELHKHPRWSVACVETMVCLRSSSVAEVATSDLSTGNKILSFLFLLLMGFHQCPLSHLPIQIYLNIISINIFLFSVIHGYWRYCSDLYPKAESYSLCNWCLKEEREKQMKEAIGNRSLSSTCSGSISNSKKNNIVNTRNSDSNEVGLKLQRCTTFQLHVNKPIKKKRSPERLTVNRSKQVFRGKVRRYKLLEEVCN